MIRMRIPTNSDYKLMSDIINKYQLSDHSEKLKDEKTFIMLEKNKVIGLSKYFIYEKTGVINLMAYDVDFMDNSYRDAFFRGTLNLMLNNGLFKGIILTTKVNDAFYKTYNFDAVNPSDISTFENENLNNKDVVNAYRVDIEEFFNRPCNG